MQNIDFLNEFVVWFKGNMSGIVVSIAASVIFFILGKGVKFLIGVYRKISWRDKEGLDYIIVPPFRSETSKEILISSIKFAIISFMVFLPYLLLFSMYKIVLSFGGFDEIVILGVILFVFILAVCVLYIQKYEKK